MALNAFEEKLKQVQPNAVLPSHERDRKSASGLCSEPNCEWFQAGRHCVLPSCFKKAFSVKQQEEARQVEPEEDSDG